MNIENTKSISEPTNLTAGPTRDNGKEYLRQLIARKQKDVNALTIIYNMLPSNPTHEQEEALFQHFCFGVNK